MVNASLIGNAEVTSGKKISPIRRDEMSEPNFVIRELEDADLGHLAGLLTEGFSRRSVEFWAARLERLRTRNPAPGTPRYGYGIEDNGLQGAALALGSMHGPEDAPQTIVNISSWTVRPSHRGPAAKELYRYASSFEGHTFSNLSAAAHTLKTITKFGFREGTAGQIIGIGTRRSPGTPRRVIALKDAPSAGLSAEKLELLRYHQDRGCVVFCLELADRLAPLVFLPRRLALGMPVAQLIYCEAWSDFIDHSRLIYTSLLARGWAALLVDASGPIPGLRGRYFPGKAAKYYKGPSPMYAVDHSYSEMIYIGF